MRTETVAPWAEVVEQNGFMTELELAMLLDDDRSTSGDWATSNHRTRVHWTAI